MKRLSNGVAMMENGNMIYHVHTLATGERVGPGAAINRFWCVLDSVCRWRVPPSFA